MLLKFLPLEVVVRVKDDDDDDDEVVAAAAAVIIMPGICCCWPEPQRQRQPDALISVSLVLVVVDRSLLFSYSTYHTQ